MTLAIQEKLLCFKTMQRNDADAMNFVGCIEAERNLALHFHVVFRFAQYGLPFAQ